MNLNWIEPGVLAAHACPASEHDVEWLHSQGIRAVVTLTERPLTQLLDIPPDLFAQLGIEHLHSPIPDYNPPGISQALAVISFIDRMAHAQKPVFMHCLAGIGRTGVMLHAYYLAHGYTLEDARKKVEAGRPAARYEAFSKSQRQFVEDFARFVAGQC